MIDDIDGEPHYSQIVEGMRVKRPSGTTYEVTLACGPLQKKRYINAKIEEELVEFKAEIKDKFHKSEMN